METETRNRPHIRPSTTREGHGSVVVPRRNTITGTAVVAMLDRDELQALVQDAYDHFGVLAVPSVATEAEQYAKRQAELEDTYLRTFADAWGRSVRARA